jgi:hypothetical protein
MIQETKHITLKNNPALRELSDYMGISTEEVRSEIITALLNYGYLTDERIYCGTDLVNILLVHHETVEGFARHCFHCSYDRLVRILTCIVIWGIEHDCPFCGCETFVEKHEKICIRSDCSFSVGLIPHERQKYEVFLINLN